MLIVFALSLYINLGRCTTLSLLIHEMVHLFIDVEILWFLSSICMVFSIQVLYMFSRLIPKYFFFFSAVSSIVFLIFMSTHSLQVYADPMEFNIFILYPMTLLNLFDQLQEVLLFNSMLGIFHLEQSYHVQLGRVLFLFF